jgi:hypothetical protein
MPALVGDQCPHDKPMRPNVEGGLRLVETSKERIRFLKLAQGPTHARSCPGEPLRLERWFAGRIEGIEYPAGLLDLPLVEEG